MQCRLGISAQEKFLGMETAPSNFQQNIQVVGEGRLLLLEAGSEPCWHGCCSTEWSHRSLQLCIPSICLDSQSIEKSKSRGGEGAFFNNSNYNLAKPKLVPRNFAQLAPFSNSKNILKECLLSHIAIKMIQVIT